jgi:hypothetical protein
MDADKVFDEIITLLPPTPVITRGKMFGMPCLKVNGKIFACFWAGGRSIWQAVAAQRTMNRR